MSGETSLSQLLQSVRPVLHPEKYVFCTINDRQDENLYRRIQSLKPIGLFREDEGLTLIIERDKAHGNALAYTSIFSLITLSVHSSLEAVGFMAAIASKLAKYNISVNPVSAYYHDHLFIPTSRAEEAMNLLEELAAENKEIAI